MRTGVQGGGVARSMTKLRLTHTLGISRSSTAIDRKTSATFAFLRGTTGLKVQFRIFNGTHRSPHMGATNPPTMMSLVAEWEELGSTMIVLPGETGALPGSPHQELLLGSKGGGLTLPNFSGSSGPDQQLRN